MVCLTYAKIFLCAKTFKHTSKQPGACQSSKIVPYTFTKSNIKYFYTVVW